MNRISEKTFKIIAPICIALLIMLTYKAWQNYMFSFPESDISAVAGTVDKYGCSDRASNTEAWLKIENKLYFTSSMYFSHDRACEVMESTLINNNMFVNLKALKSRIIELQVGDTIVVSIKQWRNSSKESAYGFLIFLMLIIVGYAITLNKSRNK